VIAAARRFGMGSLLLRAAEDRLISAGCRSVELETAVDNAAALLFYKRHGYSVVTTYPRYYSNGWMRRCWRRLSSDYFLVTL